MNGTLKAPFYSVGLCTAYIINYMARRVYNPLPFRGNLLVILRVCF
jgi:hypothetical protein